MYRQGYGCGDSPAGRIRQLQEGMKIQDSEETIFKQEPL